MRKLLINSQQSVLVFLFSDSKSRLQITSELDIFEVKLVIMRASKGDNDEITSQSEDNYTKYHYSHHRE